MDDLAHQPPVGHGVIAAVRARLPQRNRIGQRLDDRIPGDRLLERHRTVDVDKTHPVRQQPGHGSIGLTVRFELRPVLRHRSVEVQESTIGQDVGADGGRALRGGEHQLQVIGTVRGGSAGLRDAAVQVDHEFTIAVQRDGRADVTAVVEIAGERIAHSFEPRCRESGHFGHVISSGRRSIRLDGTGPTLRRRSVVRARSRRPASTSSGLGQR